MADQTDSGRVVVFEESVPAPSTLPPGGDQPEAIRQLVEGSARSMFQTPLGHAPKDSTLRLPSLPAAAGSALVLAHNKTPAAQLYSGVPRVLPENAVEQFRQLLRLLPAGGSLRPPPRPVHREGFGDQRAIEQMRRPPPRA